MAKGKVFEVSTRCQMPDGTQILDEHTIRLALTHKVIKRWAYICHDKDGRLRPRRRKRLF